MTAQVAHKPQRQSSGSPLNYLDGIVGTKWRG